MFLKHNFILETCKSHLWDFINQIVNKLHQFAQKRHLNTQANRSLFKFLSLTWLTINLFPKRSLYPSNYTAFTSLNTLDTNLEQHCSISRTSLTLSASNTRTVNQRNTVINYCCPSEKLLPPCTLFNHVAVSLIHANYHEPLCFLLTYTLHSAESGQRERERGGGSVNVITAANDNLQVYLDFNLITETTIHSVSSCNDIALSYFHWHLV